MEWEFLPTKRQRTSPPDRCIDRSRDCEASALTAAMSARQAGEVGRGKLGQFRNAVEEPGELDGRRVLIVEDEVWSSLALEEALTAAGCIVIGPVGTVVDAIRIAKADWIDAALLDIKLGGERVFEVANALRERGIPFAFL